MDLTSENCEHRWATEIEPALMAWVDQHSAQAFQQGWSLFSTDRGFDPSDDYGWRPVELQRLDEDALFPGDLEAWEFVVQVRTAGPAGAAARAALDLLRRHVPDEYAAIRLASLDTPYPLDDLPDPNRL